jgi:hypothetical protein
MPIMKFRSSIRFAAGAAVVLGCATAAQANFFERLFGTEPDPQPQQYYYQPAQPAPATEADMRRRAPIDFTVRKRVRDVAASRPTARRPSASRRTVSQPSGMRASAPRAGSGRVRRSRRRRAFRPGQSTPCRRPTGTCRIRR